MTTHATAMSFPRRLSPGAKPTGSMAGLLSAQFLAEVRQAWRVPQFLIGVVAVPVMLYAMFGLPEAGQIMAGGTDIGAMMFASLSCYGVVSLAIFTFGVDIAQERGSGWLRRLRVTPMPIWAYLAGKCAMAVIFSAAILATTLVVAWLAGGVRFDPTRLLRTCLVLLSGALAFSSMGFTLAFWARPRAAAAIGNLIFLPLAFASGFFYTLNALPSFLQDLAHYLPTYHFGQLVWNQLAPTADVVDFGSPAPDSLLLHLAWVLGCFVVFGVLAAIGYRRSLRREHR
jgi:ABC-2 type transport system permease protein